MFNFQKDTRRNLKIANGANRYLGVKQAFVVNDQEKVGFETDWGEANIAVKSNPSSWRCASWDSKFEDAIACIKLKL